MSTILTEKLATQPGADNEFTRAGKALGNMLGSAMALWGPTVPRGWHRLLHHTFTHKSVINATLSELWKRVVVS